MNISNQEFEAIHFIEFMCYNDPKQLSRELDTSEESAEKILKNLEKKELITIELRDKKIYGSKLTEKGKEIWTSPKFEKLKLELGY